MKSESGKVRKGEIVASGSLTTPYLRPRLGTQLEGGVEISRMDIYSKTRTRAKRSSWTRGPWGPGR